MPPGDGTVGAHSGATVVGPTDVPPSRSVRTSADASASNANQNLSATRGASLPHGESYHVAVSSSGSSRRGREGNGHPSSELTLAGGGHRKPGLRSQSKYRPGPPPVGLEEEVGCWPYDGESRDISISSKSVMWKPAVHIEEVTPSESPLEESDPSDPCDGRGGRKPRAKPKIMFRVAQDFV